MKKRRLPRERRVPNVARVPGVGTFPASLWLSVVLLVCGVILAVGSLRLLSKGKDSVSILMLVVAVVVSFLAAGLQGIAAYGQKIRALFGLETARQQGFLSPKEYQKARDQIMTMLASGQEGGLTVRSRKRLARVRNKRALLLVVRNQEEELKKQLRAIAQAREELEKEIRKEANR